MHNRAQNFFFEKKPFFNGSSFLTPSSLVQLVPGSGDYNKVDFVVVVVMGRGSLLYDTENMLLVRKVDKTSPSFKFREIMVMIV